MLRAHVLNDCSCQLPPIKLCTLFLNEMLHAFSELTMLLHFYGA